MDGLRWGERASKIMNFLDHQHIDTRITLNPVWQMRDSLRFVLVELLQCFDRLAQSFYLVSEGCRRTEFGCKFITFCHEMIESLLLPDRRV